MLIREIEKFLRDRGVAATTFGRLAASDPRLVFDLRNGREPRSRTEKRVRAYLEAVQ